MQHSIVRNSYILFLDLLSSHAANYIYTDLCGWLVNSPWLNHESIFQKRMKQMTNKFLNLTTTTTTTSSDTDNADTTTSGSSAAPTPQRRPRKKITSMNETGIVYNDLERSQQFHQCYQDNRNKKQIEPL